MVRYRLDTDAAAAERPSLGVVIGSAGVASFAALEVLELLEREGVRPSLVVGAGVGALVAALWSSGYHASDCMRIARESLSRRLFAPDLYTLAGIAGLPGGGFSRSAALFKPRRYRSILEQIFGPRTLESLPIPTVLVATDVDTVESVPLREGSVAEMVYASSAVFPFLPPIRIGGRWLVEGVWSTPLPLIEAGGHPVDRLLAVSFERRMVPMERGFFEFFCSLAQQNARSMERNQTALADMLNRQQQLVVDIGFPEPVAWWAFRAVPEVLRAGRRVVAQARAEILRFVGVAE